MKFECFKSLFPSNLPSLIEFPPKLRTSVILLLVEPSLFYSHKLYCKRCSGGMVCSTQLFHLYCPEISFHHYWQISSSSGCSPAQRSSSELKKVKISFMEMMRNVLYPVFDWDNIFKVRIFLAYIKDLGFLTTTT